MMQRLNLSEVDARATHMVERVTAWSNINSGSGHVEGIHKTALAIDKAFQDEVGVSANWLSLPPLKEVSVHGEMIERPVGSALLFEKRPQAPLQILLTGHSDTVYPPDDTFQSVSEPGDGCLYGPGVADMKGGIAIMLEALRAFEHHPSAQDVGWRVLISPDEEIGSPGSAQLLEYFAKKSHLGLTYEPSVTPEGGLAGARKGSANMTAVFRGRSAHAGREPEKGRNAVALMAEFIRGLEALHGARPGLSVNAARVEGGGALNRVPDLAILRFNIRVAEPDDQAFVERFLAKLKSELDVREGYGIEILGHFQRPPKPLVGETQRLFELVKACGQDLGLDLPVQDTGGVCEGNNLAAAGLPNVDTLGARGGKIHSHDEYLIVESLTERAKLSASILARLAEERRDAVAAA